MSRLIAPSRAWQPATAVTAHTIGFARRRNEVSRVCSKVSLPAEQPKDKSLVRIDCTVRGTEKDSKSGKPHDTAYFEIRKSSGELQRVVVTGSGGVRMEMQFSNWQFDPPAGDELFHFQPPKGVAIVDGEELMAGPTQLLQ